MNTSRENILHRIRLALRTEGHRPLLPSDSPVWPPDGADLVKKFRDEFAALHGELLETPEALAGFLAGKTVSGLETLRHASNLPLENIAQAPLMQADIGITGCDGLVAQTGSILISTRSAGGRALSVFPPIHLVVARRDQLVPNLESAMAVWRDRYDGRWPSQLSVITGPSRTSDIEKVLVLGAHGPKRLAVYLTA
jgi:L-lactate dehydrogenase complex protein LldG